MTVHHAKGLEFDAVFLPQVDRNPLEGEKKEGPRISWSGCRETGKNI
jgi:ATP-dependent exoDNAse (exonuclease V) beta subunit